MQVPFAHAETSNDPSRVEPLLDEYVQAVIHAESNITGTRTAERARAELVDDSLTLRPFIQRFIQAGESFDPDDTTKVIDIGAGAGAPGIPLAITLGPKAEFVLLEPKKKRSDFMQAMIHTQLQLRNASVYRERAEAAALELSMRDCFDIAVAKAVAPMPALVELALPFVRASGGALMCLKGADAPDEVARAKPAIDAAGGSSSSVELHPYNANTRYIVVVHKTDETPSWLPRKVGTAQKAPLR